MDAEPIDPRYSNEEIEKPVYRVDFWDPLQVSEEWRLTNASNVFEVLSWADARKGSRHYVLYVEYLTEEPTCGLARLTGTDPSDLYNDQQGESSSSAVATLAGLHPASPDKKN